MEPIRVLHVFHSMHNGGVEHFVMNYYRHIDRSKVQFDFLLSVDEDGFFDEEIKALGGRIFHAYPFKKNPVKNFLSISKIIKENNFDIIHRHTGSAVAYFDLWAAKFGGADRLILHSHNNQAGKNLLHSVFKKFFSLKCNRLACSVDAGKFTFGDKKSFIVVSNSIECEKFEFNEEFRQEKRESLSLKDEFLIGHIGRFEDQKNHKYIIDIFDEYLKINPNSRLALIGVGRHFEEIQNKSKQLGIYDKIFFLGARNDAYKYYSAFDAFLLPSLYEGLGIVLVEAQCNGLPCLISKDVIPEEVDFNLGLVKRESINDAACVWAQRLDTCRERKDSKEAIGAISEKGFNISTNAEWLCEYYKNLM